MNESFPGEWNAVRTDNGQLGISKVLRKAALGRPKFITFTGVDEHTRPEDLLRLHTTYPVEFGVLLTPSRQGKEPRYPSLRIIDDVIDRAASGGIALAAHLCGQHARDALIGATDMDAFMAKRFARVQVNTTAIDFNTHRLASRMLRYVGAKVILQCRRAFPLDARVQWLFDASGGRGVVPETWPAPPSRTRWVGYAGGLNPANVAGHVEHLGALSDNYWIDMESGVRDEQDRFDIDRVEAVCHAVYGEAIE